MEWWGGIKRRNKHRVVDGAVRNERLDMTWASKVQGSTTGLMLDVGAVDPDINAEGPGKGQFTPYDKEACRCRA